MVVLSGFEHDFLVEFSDLFADEFEDFSSLSGEAIIAARAASAGRVSAAFEPAHAFHAFQQWVKGAGADFVAVPAQLSGDPLSVDGLLPCVMEDMDLPKAQEDFTAGAMHGGISYYGCRYRVS